MTVLDATEAEAGLNTHPKACHLYCQHLPGKAWCRAHQRRLDRIRAELDAEQRGVWNRLDAVKGRGSRGASQFPELGDAAWLRREYVDRGRSTADVARELGCSANSVWRALRRLGVPARGRGERAAA